MSADLLRLAAEKLREHADAAAGVHPPPWYEAPYDPIPQRGVWSAYGSTPIATVAERSEQPTVSAFIALLHPPVALALADLFELQADFTDRTSDARVGEPLAAVARAILREDA